MNRFVVFTIMINLLIMKFLGGCGTPLVQAVRKNDVNKVKTLLQQGVDVNMQIESNGSTALYEASFLGYKNSVEILLENNANPNIQNKLGFTPLYAAAQERHGDIVKLLLHYDADPNFKAQEDWTAIMIASAKGHPDIVRILCENGANPNTHNEKGMSTLDLAWYFGHSNIVSILIDKNVNINAANKIGNTSLMRACTLRNTEEVQYLLSHGAVVNQKNNRGINSLMIASEHGFGDIVKILIDQGANINDVDNNKYSALLRATEKDHIDLARYLILEGAKPSIVEGSRDALYATGLTHQLFAEYLAKNNQSDIPQYIDVSSEYYEKASAHYQYISSVAKDSDQQLSSDNTVFAILAPGPSLRLALESRPTSNSKPIPGPKMKKSISTVPQPGSLDRVHVSLNEKSNICSRRAKLCQQALELFKQENDYHHLYDSLLNIFNQKY